MEDTLVQENQTLTTQKEKKIGHNKKYYIGTYRCKV